MSKHTPGPWTLETVPTSVGICHKIGPFPSTSVEKEGYACVYADNVWPGEGGRDKIGAELLANAHLIAAAPDLLEVLENLENDAGQIPDHAWALIQAAIAKATHED